jgi:hypothetical protein
MKKTKKSNKPLRLNLETLRQLDSTTLKVVAGGLPPPTTSDECDPDFSDLC